MAETYNPFEKLGKNQIDIIITMNIKIRNDLLKYYD